MAESVIYRQEGRVVTLTLNEPETRNAISPAIVEALVAACERVNGDMSVSAVILTGAGEGFSSGGNVKEMEKRAGGLFSPKVADTRRGYWHGIQRIPRALHELEVPSIAAVNGAAIGAGCDLSLMCDIRIASDKAVFGESFLRVGLVSGDGGAWFLPRVVGLSRAYEMTFTGDFLDAETAARYGLVSKVVAHDALLEEANKLAARIVRHPPHSLRLTKRLLRNSLAMTLGDNLEMAAALQAIVQQTEDQHEAVKALNEKRPGKFTGN